MVAHIWKVKGGWMLEIAEGSPGNGWAIVDTRTFPTKAEAKQWARDMNVQPWNY